MPGLSERNTPFLEDSLVILHWECPLMPSKLRDSHRRCLTFYIFILIYGLPHRAARAAATRELRFCSILGLFTTISVTFYVRTFYDHISRS
ncbi:hypothetical protein EVAR_48007_1 [Eumeta japonica]|uniref:Uncharacterized protein n=1 Tax=Eumeta variegata TaxID=151549 RepID=A0A4C1XN96_EUMVA|nr:hypothetical protein EVAR_48007_1 [Eumeta japonica]